VVAEARSLWYSIPSNSYSSLSESGADGLLAVARSTSDVREQFFQQILKNQNIAADFSAHPGMIMSAVAGINARLRENIASAFQAAIKPELPNEIHVAHALDLLELNFASPEILIEAIGKTTYPDQLKALGQGLAAVAGKLGKTQADIMSNELTAALIKNTTGSQSNTLAGIASVLVPRLTMNDSLAKQWLEIYKNPFIDRNVIAEAIRKNNPDDAPKEEQGLWAFLEWVVKRYDVDDD